MATDPEDLVTDAVADGVYTEAEKAELAQVFEALSFKDKLELLRDVATAVDGMPGSGDHGAWSALLDVQDHLRDEMPGAGASPRIGWAPDFLEAKRLLRKYADDGVLDTDERKALKDLLHRLTERDVERLHSFANRRAEYGLRPTRRVGFAKIRRFIEHHQNAGEWKSVMAFASLEGES